MSVDVGTAAPGPLGRQRIILLGGCPIIMGLAAYLLWPDRTQAVAIGAVPTSPLRKPPALPASFVPPPAAPPRSTSSPDLSRYVLVGIGGGGEKGRAAIIALPNGGQRVLPAGRVVAPGVTVKEVGMKHAILATAGGDVRLVFGKAAEMAPTAAPAAPAPDVAFSSMGSPPSPVARREMVTRYRLGMEATKLGQNITGYRVKSSSPLPLLSAAGLEQGDVLISVNGELLDSEERLHALPDLLASEPATELVLERNGRRITRKSR